MQCPNCATQLTMSERQGIEIDYCPSCRGVWLDRGELDKIIERNASQPNAAPAPSLGAPQPQWSGHDYGYGHHHQPHRKRRKGFLEELFD